ncbi:hypothetical protein HWV62_29306 [Athelia sp. TMB]|nr:hypothetical protein HWV62_29306 [Athelia sp. TMB]
MPTTLIHRQSLHIFTPKPSYVSPLPDRLLEPHENMRLEGRENKAGFERSMGDGHCWMLLFDEKGDVVCDSEEAEALQVKEKLRTNKWSLQVIRGNEKRKVYLADDASRDIHAT